MKSNTGEPISGDSAQHLNDLKDILGMINTFDGSQDQQIVITNNFTNLLTDAERVRIVEMLYQFRNIPQYCTLFEALMATTDEVYCPEMPSVGSPPEKPKQTERDTVIGLARNSVFRLYSYLRDRRR